MALILPRRRFLAGLVGIIAAPAIVRVDNIMKVASPPVLTDFQRLYAAEFDKALQEHLTRWIAWPPLVEVRGGFRVFDFEAKTA